jgi:hypothetical protein
MPLINCQNRRNAIAKGGRLKRVLQGAPQCLAAYSTSDCSSCIATKAVQFLADFGAKQPLTPPQIQHNATNLARSFPPACKH